MTRKYLNDRWCVRCGRDMPTPYLVANLKHLPEFGRVLDIGCGNGRNSQYLKSLGYEVDSIDMAGDFGIKTILGHDDLPNNKYDVILANYVLMFLNSEERAKVMNDILDRAAKNCVLMIEMYAAKDAHPFDFNEIMSFFLKNGWMKVRKSKERCILRK